MKIVNNLLMWIIMQRQTQDNVDVKNYKCI